LKGRYGEGEDLISIGIEFQIGAEKPETLLPNSVGHLEMAR